RLQVVELAGDVDGQARQRRRERGRVRRGGPDLRVGRARLGRELSLGAQRRGGGGAHLAGRQVQDEALEVVGGIGDAEVDREVAVRAALAVGGGGGHAGGAEAERARGREQGDGSGERRTAGQAVE